MAELKQLNIPGIGSVQGTDVQIIETVERWTEVKLDDGTVLRVKPIVLSVLRVEGKYDPQGNPMYAIQGGQAMVIVSVPPHLRRQDTPRKIN